MKTTWRIEAKKTHMVNHVIKICDVILGPHNVRNGSYKMLAASLGKGVRKVEQLKPLLGWEDWAQGKKVKRCMEYLSD